MGCFTKLCVIAMAISTYMVVAQHPVTNAKITNIVVVGATGDLAKRYLWQGFFNLFVEFESTNHHFRFYGAARNDAIDGEQLLQYILQEHVSCSRLTVRPLSSTCDDLHKKFVSLVQYRQLNTAEQYQSLCVAFADEVQREHAQENGRWFYLAVPAFAYAGIVKNTGDFCRPSDVDAWLRVILEKPFGHDLESAQELSEQLTRYLQEEEMYKIDHYLGKTGVSFIMTFRNMNKHQYERIWNNDHVEKVEVVMKEALDVKGRYHFYNKYGVMRDVMQNHLTEIVALFAMEIPQNISSPEQHALEKMLLLNNIQSLRKRHAVIGQYEGYEEELREELGEGNNFTSLVPTFAGVSMSINSPRWTGVPFILVSGKKMDTRSGYIRIVFKQNTFCADEAAYKSSCRLKQIVIYTGGTRGTKPMLLVSKSLAQPVVPESWKASNLWKDIELFGTGLENFYHFSPSMEADAYSALLKSCFLGQKQNFIGSKDLMQSWKIWTPLLKSLEATSPRKYPGGVNNGGILDFVTEKSGCRFTTVVEPVYFDEGMMNRNTFVKTMSFRNDPLVSGSEMDVVQALAQDIYNSSLISIKARGNFHLALSGGKTPIPLFHKLTQISDFPWEETHIWFVDERCVSFDDDSSNFRMILNNLIQFVKIPYMNIHPMPVHGVWEDCGQTQSDYYDHVIRLATKGLDFVVLGLGADGHTASMFPGSPALDEATKYIVMTTTSKKSRRLSMTYPVINTARSVAVLVIGSEKATIISKIQDGMRDKKLFPITGVIPVSGSMRWYIDDSALIS